MTHAETGGKSGRFKLLKIYQSIISYTLKEEIARRKIPFDLADIYLRQVYVMDRKTQKKYIALAFQNKANDYEINIPYPTKKTSHKATIGINTYTFIEGFNRDHVEVFQNFWDFLTWLTMMNYQLPKFSSYILNGKRTINDMKASLENRFHHTKSVADFFNNDETGEELREQLMAVITDPDIKYAAHNYLYRDHKGLSDYWVDETSAIDIWPPKED